MDFHLPCRGVTLAVVMGLLAQCAAAQPPEADVERVTQQGLDWLASQQQRLGHWTTQGRYPAAMTSLAGIAMMCEGSTTTQGRYAENLQRAVDYLTSQARPNGLIGDPLRDDRYTYGHGFGMLFLSQVLGEEEDIQRREELIEILNRAVRFSGQAQTEAGGWGYVSAKEGNGFDEGSTTITQVQGLRGCRNAGIAVPKEVIDNAVDYIYKCTMKDGGVQYSSKGGGGRPAITAAAIASLFNAGEYDSDHVPRMLKYCQQHLGTSSRDSYGHWHYGHFYYSQVQYREGGEEWDSYRAAIYSKLLKERKEVNLPGGGKAVMWDHDYMGSVYTTCLNLIILQLDEAALPIYQR